METPIPALNPEGVRGYISAQGVANLDTYSYRGKDQSYLVQYIFKYFWDWLLDRFVPTTIAPNLITLCGFSCVLTAFLLQSYWATGAMEGWVPNWVFLVTAVLIFCYQTLDNLDGKQARKTGSASALGEVFDHGADALTVPMFVLIMGTSFQLGPVYTFICMILLTTLFYLPHWEGYFTGVLLLRPTSNPTEAQWGLITLLLITFFQGNLFWQEQVNTYLFGNIEGRTILLFLFIAGFVSTSYEHFSAVYQCMIAKGQGMGAPLLALVPLGFLLTLATAWVSCDIQLLEQSPRLFIGTIGLLFAYLAIRIIVQGVTKEPFKPYYNVLTPPACFVLNALFGVLFTPILDNFFVLQWYFFIVLLHDLFLVTSLVYEFSFYLKIHPFSIAPTLPTVQTEAQHSTEII